MAEQKEKCVNDSESISVTSLGPIEIYILRQVNTLNKHLNFRI